MANARKPALIYMTNTNDCEIEINRFLNREGPDGRRWYRKDHLAPTGQEMLLPPSLRPTLHLRWMQAQVSEDQGAQCLLTWDLPELGPEKFALAIIGIFRSIGCPVLFLSKESEPQMRESDWNDAAAAYPAEEFQRLMNMQEDFGTESGSAKALVAGYGVKGENLMPRGRTYDDACREVAHLRLNAQPQWTWTAIQDHLGREGYQNRQPVRDAEGDVVGGRVLWTPQNVQEAWHRGLDVQRSHA